MTDETRQSPAETVSHDLDDHLDDCVYDDDEEEDREADCGRWRNGRLVPQCILAGSEWCDWECPIGLPVSRKRANARQGNLELDEQPSTSQRTNDAEPTATDTIIANTTVTAQLGCGDGGEAADEIRKLREVIERMKGCLREALTDGAWNAYNCGITRPDGKWMDGGMSDAEWLQRELGLKDGWHDANMIRSRIPEIVEKQIATISTLPSTDGRKEPTDSREGTE